MYELVRATRARRAADSKTAAAHQARLKAIESAAYIPAMRPATLLADSTYQFDMPEVEHCDWAKQVDSIDTAAKNGYAFVGEWLPKPGNSAILAAGELILTGGKYRSGSPKA